MKKRILVLTDGNIDNASARIRAIQYIPFFEAHGYKVAHIPRVPQRPTGQISKYTVFPVLKRWYSFKMGFSLLFRKWDVVFIQRIFIGQTFLKQLNKRSISIIYDFDDAIYINPRRPSDQEKTAIMIRNSTKVIVSTDYLAKFCRDNGQNPALIPSPVETDRIRPSEKQQNQTVTIGWIGSPWTSGFLELIEKPLIRLAEKYTFRFLTIGAKPEYRIPGINHIAKPWVFEEENDVLGQMNIGLMPLPSTEFAKMKGGYKLLQYMSAGLPCIASPVGINQTIVKTGENGYLASSEDEWYEALEKLLLDPVLRLRMGANGRKEALELYSREVCFEKLLEIIQEL